MTSSERCTRYISMRRALSEPLRDSEKYSASILALERGGGTESPLLYSLYVFDLVQRLGSLDLDGEPVILDGKEIRVLQFADDVALLATSEEDLDRLLHE